MRGATLYLYKRYEDDTVSIHAPRAGRDIGCEVSTCSASGFNPRAPCGARLQVTAGTRHLLPFQSTRPVRGATRFYLNDEPYEVVSIHAPRAGRDLGGRYSSTYHSCFNPRAPCGARRVQSPFPAGLTSFNPRAPCGARLTHFACLSLNYLFQSTRPVRGATTTALRAMQEPPVSIHAPRAGRDRSVMLILIVMLCFNPRAPCGARRHQKGRRLQVRRVSIHAPRAGRDTHQNHLKIQDPEFQSTRPVRGATLARSSL